jgi:hypothetical protein
MVRVVLMVLMVRWKGNGLHAFGARRGSTGGATIVRVTVPASQNLQNNQEVQIHSKGF